MRRSASLFLVIVIAVLAGLVLKSDRGHGQGQGPQAASVVSQVFLKNQTQTAFLNLFTPTSNGLYRVSAYANVTPNSNPGAVCATLAWNDEAGSQSVQFLTGFFGSCAQAGLDGSGWGSVLVHSVPNQPVTLTIGPTDNSSGQFNVFVTVEQL
jgi:hypothetical protein